MLNWVDPMQEIIEFSVKEPIGTHYNLFLVDTSTGLWRQYVV